MSRRTVIILWVAVAVAVFLLGSGVATIRRVVAGGTLGDYIVLSLAWSGVVAALVVAGRIVFVTARAQRRSSPS